jgi:hypothetical protein
MVIFQLDVVHNWPNKLLQKFYGWKIVSFYCPSKSVVILKPQIGDGGTKGSSNIGVVSWTLFPSQEYRSKEGIVKQWELVKPSHPLFRKEYSI